MKEWSGNHFKQELLRYKSPKDQDPPMICVECGEPVSSSYTLYTNGYIKLTDCPRCHCIADKYIEVDNVVLFIDILLLKPQAYKHLVFNADFVSGLGSMEVSANNYMEEERERDRSKRIKRIRILSILFEIYLSWAYQEKNFNTNQYYNSHSIYHNLLVKNVMVQYFYFGLKCALEDFLTHRLVNWFVFNYFGWSPKINISPISKPHKAEKKHVSSKGHKVAKDQKRKQIGSQELKEKAYLSTVISLTIIISSGTKLFPILMLIWPYDDLAITNIIVAIANFNLIESLRIVTGLRIRQTVFIFSVLTLVRFIATRLVLATLISQGDLVDCKLLLTNEVFQIRESILNGIHWVQMYL
ncbi:hypothetical protein WICPIJ_002284 [Wickerhamomyces pijperi]|uniref:Protein ARV n=1 Tax=Wickerhamomyces pijperi TaxID=599730 RepID=A0A9P8QA45_WICPI|nr:hypothetical protein WICPIJ_002284 [Wickerhamomyces pijperi]